MHGFDRQRDALAAADTKRNDAAPKAVPPLRRPEVMARLAGPE